MDTLYGISAETVAERTGVDVSTARRWKTGATRMPRSARQILEADLGCFGSTWRGWKLDGEDLVSPEGWRISKGQVMNVPLMRQQLAAYQTELRAMKDGATAHLEEQPMPDVAFGLKVAG